MAVFRPFSSSDALRSDRSAGDRFDLRVIALAPITYSAALIDPLGGLTPLTVDSAGSATLPKGGRKANNNAAPYRQTAP